MQFMTNTSECLSRKRAPGGTISAEILQYAVVFRVDGIRLAREQQVNVRVVATGKAVEESADPAREVHNPMFRKVSGKA